MDYAGLVKKLEDAYKAYYNTNSGMPYDIDTTMSDAAVAIKELQSEVEHWKNLCEISERLRFNVERELKFSRMNLQQLFSGEMEEGCLD